MSRAAQLTEGSPCSGSRTTGSRPLARGPASRGACGCSRVPTARRPSIPPARTAVRSAARTISGRRCRGARSNRGQRGDHNVGSSCLIQQGHNERWFNVRHVAGNHKREVGSRGGRVRRGSRQGGCERCSGPPRYEYRGVSCRCRGADDDRLGEQRTETSAEPVEDTLPVDHELVFRKAAVLPERSQ